MDNFTKEIENIKINTETAIDQFLAFAQKNNAAVAIYRLPNDSRLQIICDLEGGSIVEDFNLDDLSTGFLLHPFQEGEKSIVHFNAEILAEINIQSNHKNHSKSEIKWNNTPDESLVKEIFENSEKFNFSLLQHNGISDSISSEGYISMVENAIKEIKNNTFYKVVPAKTKNIEYNNSIDLGKAFLKAAHKYPNAFVSLTFSENTGLWFGASPETLIEEKKGDYFKTMALAGTQAIEDKSIAETTWTQKEIEEQAYVSRYIINCFKKIRLRDFDELGPKTVQAGNLLHLKTTFKVDTKSVHFPELGSVMLKLLHPTSAVCGMPKDTSLKFILEKEKHDRAYFSGFLGPIHLNEMSHLFVNLRCCQIDNEKVTFYAGAGITEDSKPEKEWHETEMKCKVLSAVVFGK
ncbi:chorismate-binding protein [Marivirga arenosa]|uniref:Chorismate-binding protein n=1 Tax=Marivirga arenosa TaxID=3059076 RepID=A0AA51N6L2_9BACT|nr:chorismate-binding protein [Marivirga sp. ABR2-2]WMN07134.1 chorismate-binding protein [Marivirga sp. ABR2-2]